jgi:Ion transport protein
MVRTYLDTDRYTNLGEMDIAQALRLMKLIRFIRVIKLTQIFKLRKLIYRYEWFFFNDKIGIVIDFLKIFLFIFFFVHWLACIFFLISNFEIVDDPNTWMTLLNKGDAKSAIDAYIASASWSFTTVASVGYGDIYPITNAEKIFGIVAMMVSCGIFSIIVGILSTLFDKNDQIVAELQ